MDKLNKLAQVRRSKVARIWLRWPVNVDKSKDDGSNFEFVGQAAFEDGDVEGDRDRWKWRADKMAIVRTQWFLNSMMPPLSIRGKRAEGPHEEGLL